ncbi:restriction endonuclease, partial [Clostridium beijerinckii]|uniref:restriction endonuclease n=1 Tax=Clostridium beijerinckii TaxID=1520 RepID=UPI0005A36F4B
MNGFEMLEDEKLNIKEKEAVLATEYINISEFRNVSTGHGNHLYTKLKESIKNAKAIDIIVSFLMDSGVKMILEDLKEAIDRNVSIRILTGSYLNITSPTALYMLKGALKDKVDLRFYNVRSKSFHPKSYIFHTEKDSEIYIGSSNLSKGALTDSIEWNYRFLRSQNPEDFNDFYSEFENLFNNHSEIINDKVIKDYSKNWKRSQVYKDLERPKENETNENEFAFESKGAQIEALYEFENSRGEGFDKGLVVAARSFKNVRKSEDIGFFYNSNKYNDKEMIFALVQTLGKEDYLNKE